MSRAPVRERVELVRLPPQLRAGREQVGKEFQIGGVKGLDTIEETSGGGAVEVGEMLKDR